MRRIASYGRRNLGVIFGVFALVAALTGSAAVANHGHFLKLGMFDQSSRDRLAGSGVIQYGAQAYNTGTSASANQIHTYVVNCEGKKKASAGGFKWTSPTAPTIFSYQVLDQYPTGSGYVVRLRIFPGGTAENKSLTVYANCVKSREQRGTPAT